jgi:3'(2'), 5'-bisphosphate nucleotidase
MGRLDNGLFPFDRAAPGEVAVFLAEAALAAGPAVMDIYAKDGRAWTKSDGSPVTLADKRSEAVISAFLERAAPTIPIVAEEAVCAGKAVSIADRFFLIDPLDGTREFLAHNGEFTVNVALVEGGRPVAGAVYAPAIATLWYGARQAFVCDAPLGALTPGGNARRICTRPAPRALVAVASRSHCDAETEACLERLPIAERRSRGSSLKFCLIAEGEADVYPRCGPTMEWDTAAGDAVLRAAGGIVLDASGAALAYGKTDKALRNGAFVAWGDPTAPCKFALR